MSPQEENEFLDKILTILSEHYDAVQIVATKLRSDGCTVSKHRGMGNFYARRALCQEFIELDQASQVAKAISEEKES